MAEVHGSCDDRFSGVREALERNLDTEELGASIAVDLAEERSSTSGVATATRSGRPRGPGTRS